MAASRCTFLVVAVWCVTVVTPAPASANTTIGSNSKDYVGCNQGFVVFDRADVIPADGDITSFSYKSYGAGAEIDFKLLRPTGGDSYQVVGSSGVKTTTTTSTVETFHLGTPIAAQAGDLIGMFTHDWNTHCVSFWDSGPATAAWWYTGGLNPADGAVFTAQNDPGFYDGVNVSATLGAANSAPSLGEPAADANGNEGDTLSTSGSFSDSDIGDTLTVSVPSGTPGTFTDKGNGEWEWSLGTTDQTSGSITVTVSDGNGGSATDTFDYSAVNVNPDVATSASDASGLKGQTLTASGAFADVSGDQPLALSADNAVGTFTDNGDGTWSWSYPAADIGAGSITVTANDGDGGSATDTFAYEVDYDWAGFFSPLNRTGTDGYVLNKTKAGSAIPVKFSLDGDQGLSIFETGDPSTTSDNSPSSQKINCNTQEATVDPVEQTVSAGSSSLSYDALTDTYTYVWKTNKAWGSPATCRRLDVTLVDGETYSAYFQFTK